MIKIRTEFPVIRRPIFWQVQGEGLKEKAILLLFMEIRELSVSDFDLNEITQAIYFLYIYTNNIFFKLFFSVESCNLLLGSTLC